MWRVTKDDEAQNWINTTILSRANKRRIPGEKVTKGEYYRTLDPQIINTIDRKEGADLSESAVIWKERCWILVGYGLLQYYKGRFYWDKQNKYPIDWIDDWTEVYSWGQTRIPGIKLLRLLNTYN